MAQPQQSIGEKIQNSLPNPTQLASNVGATLSGVKESVTNSLNEFSSAKVLNAGNDFAQSNSIVAKFAFLILVVIGFMLLYRIGVIILSIFLSPSDNPYLIKGMIDGGDTGEIPQDPRSKTYGYVQPSVDGQTGAEFTYSVWISLKDVAGQTSSGGGSVDNYKRIFNKGTVTTDSNKIAPVNNAPGLYVKQDASGTGNVLNIRMDTTNADGSKASTDVLINQIPFNKWVHVAIRLQNKLLDVYINGEMTKRVELPSMAKQNGGSVYYGGFTGKLSNLRYYSYALNVMELKRIVWYGPDESASANITKPSTVGMSRDWYSTTNR